MKAILLLLALLLLIVIGCGKSNNNAELESIIYADYKGHIEYEVEHDVKNNSVDEDDDEYAETKYKKYSIVDISSTPSGIKDIWRVSLRYLKDGKERERIEEWSYRKSPFGMRANCVRVVYDQKVSDNNTRVD